MKTEQPFWLSSKGIAALALIGAASYFLLMEHSQHLFEFLPFLIILLCPLMHIFMHGGHGDHGEHEGNESDNTHHNHQSDAYKEGFEAGQRESNKHLKDHRSK